MPKFADDKKGTFLLVIPLSFIFHTLRDIFSLFSYLITLIYIYIMYARTLV